LYTGNLTAWNLSMLALAECSTHLGLE